MAPKVDGTAKSVNALLNLLTVAGLSTVDNSRIEREIERCSIEIRTDNLPEETQAWDRPIEKLIRQLKDSIRDRPERDILTRDSGLPLDYEPTTDQEQFVPASTGEEDRRQYLEREFSQTSYPKIGPGYSDSISVVSDLTIPTVIAGLAPEEEKYIGPPMQIGFTPKPNKSLRRPSLEKNGSGPTADRRAFTTDLRPPSRRIVTRPGGAAASRRQSHQMTMAQLQAAAPPSSSRRDAATSKDIPSVTMTVNDFPSLKDASRSKELALSGSGRRGADGRTERRSLLGKSNKYADSVKATASQRMLIARKEGAKAKKPTSRRRSDEGRKDGADDGFGFTDDASKKSSDPILVDEDGLNGGESDPFAEATPFESFGDDTFGSFFPAGPTSAEDDAAGGNSFFPLSATDTQNKKFSSNNSGDADPFAPSAPFDAAFSKDSFRDDGFGSFFPAAGPTTGKHDAPGGSSFFPLSAKDTQKKKKSSGGGERSSGARRSSMAGNSKPKSTPSGSRP